MARRLIKFKTLVYTKTRVTGPNFLFTVRITRRGVVALLALLTFLLFLKSFLNGLEHGRHIGQLLVAPKFLVGLTCVGGLTWGCTKGLAILVVLATVAGVVRHVRAAVSLASLAKLLGANLLRDSLR